MSERDVQRTIKKAETIAIKAETDFMNLAADRFNQLASQGLADTDKAEAVLRLLFDEEDRLSPEDKFDEEEVIVSKLIK